MRREAMLVHARARCVRCVACVRMCSVLGLEWKGACIKRGDVCRCRAPKETGLSSHLNPYGEAGGAQTLAPVPTE